MKKLAIVLMIAIISLSLAVAHADTQTEEVQFLEANGRVIGIFLNTADKKSACDGKTVLLTKDQHMGKIKGSERFHGEPHAAINWYTKTVINAEILYRNQETELDSLFEGSVLCLRGLNSDRSRNDDIGEAAYLFMALLDREGRKIDTVDFVFKTNDKVVFSITHIRVGEEKLNYYLVVGDARKGDPKPAKKKEEKKEEEPKKEDTDWTIQPVAPEDGDTPEDTDWTITPGDQSDPDPDPDPSWTITPGTQTDPEPDPEPGWTIGGGDTNEDTNFTIGGGDTSDVSLLPDDWSIGGGSSQDSQGSSSDDTDWTI